LDAERDWGLGHVSIGLLGYAGLYRPNLYLWANWMCRFVPTASA
jgi:hypothetical protein